MAFPGPGSGRRERGEADPGNCLMSGLSLWSMQGGQRGSLHFSCRKGVWSQCHARVSFSWFIHLLPLPGSQGQQQSLTPSLYGSRSVTEPQVTLSLSRATHCTVNTQILGSLYFVALFVWGCPLVPVLCMAQPYSSPQVNDYNKELLYFSP